MNYLIIRVYIIYHRDFPSLTAMSILGRNICYLTSRLPILQQCRNVDPCCNHATMSIYETKHSYLTSRIAFLQPSRNIDPSTNYTLFNIKSSLVATSLHCRSWVQNIHYLTSRLPLWQPHCIADPGYKTYII